MIEVKNLYKSYGEKGVLSDINLSVTHGQSVAVVGKSGAGKSVLLRCLIGLVKPDKGTIYVDNKLINTMNFKQLQSIRSKIGMVFQHFNLVGNLSSLNNVLTGLLALNGTIASLFFIFEKKLKIRAEKKHLEKNLQNGADMAPKMVSKVEPVSLKGSFKKHLEKHLKNGAKTTSKVTPKMEPYAFFIHRKCVRLLGRTDVFLCERASLWWSGHFFILKSHNSC